MYKQTNFYNNKFNDINYIKREQNNGNSFDIVAIGSSQAKYAFSFDDESIDGINLACRPQPLSIDFVMLSNNIDKIQRSGTVIISLCLLEFFMIKFSDKNSILKYSQLLSYNQIAGNTNYSYAYYTIRRYFPLLFEPINVRYILKDVQLNDVLCIKRNLCDTLSKLEEDADYWINLWNKEFQIKIPEISVSPELIDNFEGNIAVLKRIISICKLKNLNPIIIIPPVTDVLLSRFSNEFLNTFLYSNIDKSNIENIPILNYLSDSEFSEYSLYFNSFFLNLKGRKKFTERVIGDIKQIQR